MFWFLSSPMTVNRSSLGFGQKQDEGLGKTHQPISDILYHKQLIDQLKKGQSSGQ